MSARFFNSESPVWKPFGWIGDLVLLSLLWFVISVPLVTIGAATTALYDAVVHGFRKKEPETVLRFFSTLKAEFKTATLTTLLWAVVLGVLYYVIRLFGNRVEVNDATTVVTLAGLVILIVIVGVVSWVFPLLSRFTFDTKGLSGTAVKLAVQQLPSTIILGGITVLCGFLCIRFWIPFFFLPAVMTLLWSLLTERVFKRYEPAAEESEEDTEEEQVKTKGTRL